MWQACPVTTQTQARDPGLSAAEVADRIAQGQLNHLPPRSGRTVADIVRANVFTRINAILAVLLAFVLANAAAGVLAYVGMRLWAFRDRRVSDPSTGLVRFFALGALTMLVPVLCLWVSRYVLGLSGPVADNVSANVIGLGLGTAARFWVFRRYVFDELVPVEA